MKNEPTAQNFDDFSKICNRLRLIRSVFFGDDNYKFAEALGIHHSNASKLINGVSEPSHKTLSNLIANTPNLSPDWAVSGVGSIYRGVPTSPHAFALLFALLFALYFSLSFGVVLSLIAISFAQSIIYANRTS